MSHPRLRKKVFKYPIGTKIVRDFGADGIFVGTISSLFEDDPTQCQVVYTDGDQEDMDEEEIMHDIQLHRVKQKLDK